MVSTVTITDSGDFYSSPPTVTISAPEKIASDFTASALPVITNAVLSSLTITDSGNFYTDAPSVIVSAPTKVATDFTATGVANMNPDDSDNSILSVTMTNAGRFYTELPTVIFDSATGDSNHFRAAGHSVVHPTNRTITGIVITARGKYYEPSKGAPSIYIAPPILAKYSVGEKISHQLATTKLRGEITNFNSETGVMSLVHVGADDGKYHTFAPGSDSDIVGGDHGFRTKILTVKEVNKISSNEQNEEFAANVSGTTLDFLDFSETNPFGDPGDE